MKSFLKFKVTAAFILVLVFFSVLAFTIRTKMYEKTNKLILDVIKTNSRGYSKLLEYNFEGYQKLIEDIGNEFLTKPYNYQEVDEYLEEVTKKDITIACIGLLDSNYNLKIESGNKEVWEKIRAHLKAHKVSNSISSEVVNDNYLLFNYIPDDYKDGRVCIVIKLHSLYQKFIVENIYTSVYQVVLNSKQQCIYHPDEKHIGKKYHLSENICKNGHYITKNVVGLEHSYSNYLSMPAYKSYSQINIAGEEWLVISVSPGFEAKDLIAGLEKTILLLFILFLVTIIGIFFYGALQWKKEYEKRMTIEGKNLSLQLKHSRQKNETIAMKLELLRSGLNSHFLFNSLGALKALVDDKDKHIKKAFTDLSRLYRYQLQVEGEQVVTLKEEFEFTKTYVNIINLRLGNAVELEINNLKDFFNFKVLAISLQTLVENCIKHNIVSKQQPLKIKIEVKGGMLFVINELKPKLSTVESSGKGLSNLQNRYALLINKKCIFSEKSNHFIAAIPIIDIRA